MKPEIRQPSEWRKAVPPVALGLTVVWCSGHAAWFPEGMTGSDKVVHLLIFGCIATAVARLATVQRTRPIGIYAAVLIVSAFGATDELHQHFTPGRTMDFFDWVADTTGALLATALYARWPGYRRWLEAPAGWRFAKRRVEIAGRPCVIAGNGPGPSPETDRGVAVADRAT